MKTKRPSFRMGLLSFVLLLALVFPIQLSDAALPPFDSSNLVIDNKDKFPIANNDSDMTTKNTPVTTNVLANDKNLQNTPITVTVISQPGHGATAVNPDNTVTYRPATNFLGTDSYRYQVCNVYIQCSSATVTISVVDNNRPPVAVDDTASTTSNTSVLIDVLANDYDPDGDPLSLTSVTQPGHGMTTISGNKIFYTPSLNYSGTDHFSYVVSDGNGAAATGNVSVIVTNAAPVAVSDAYSTSPNTTLSIAAPGVLANDSSVNGAQLTAILVTPPAHGTLTLNNDGSFTYIPSQNYAGQDTFTYLSNDGQQNSNNANVSIQIRDSTNPVVNWIAPVNNEGVMNSGIGLITLQVSATDDVAVDYVRFVWWNANINQFVDLGNIYLDPYQLSINTQTLNDGWNQIFAIAYDTSGNASQRQYIWLYVAVSGFKVFLPFAAIQ